jgi:SAM-dependent methyltransferase
VHAAGIAALAGARFEDAGAARGPSVPSPASTSEITTSSIPEITTCGQRVSWLTSAFVIFQDPLAYLLGLEGIALLDAWAGDHDREFTETRLAEIRRLLDDEKLRDRGVLAERVSTVTAYEQQSAGYDAEAGGGLFATDEPVVAEYLSGREPGVALDAACGTGRFAEFLARRGHQVIGVDSSPGMLAHARRRVPDGEFHVAKLDRLPLPDDSVDVIVCALALVHVPRLPPVMAELARVLRPGGDLVISDIHHELVTRGSVITARGPAGEPCIVDTYRHQLGDYLRAALSVGLQVKRCEEPRASRLVGPPYEPATQIGEWRDWPWSLMDYLPSAARAAGGRPSLVIWHFRLPGG